jgi:hypothetical protein
MGKFLEPKYMKRKMIDFGFDPIAKEETFELAYKIILNTFKVSSNLARLFRFSDFKFTDYYPNSSAIEYDNLNFEKAKQLIIDTDQGRLYIEIHKLCTYYDEISYKGIDFMLGFTIKVKNPNEEEVIYNCLMLRGDLLWYHDIPRIYELSRRKIDYDKHTEAVMSQKPLNTYKLK